MLLSALMNWGSRLWTRVRALPFYVWAIVLAAILGAGLRTWRIGAESFWFDETATGVIISASPAGICNYLHDRDGHPPLYYLLLKGWAILGSSDGMLRAFSALAGIAALLLLARMAWRLAGPGAACVAAYLVAFSPYLIAFSREARCYSLLFALAAGSLNLLIDLKADRGPRWKWWALAVLTSAIMYTHYLGSLFIVSEVALVLIWRVELRRFALAAAGAFALYLPWLPTMVHHVGVIHESFWIPPPTVESVILSFQDLTTYFTWHGSIDRPLLSGAVLAIAVAGACQRGWWIWSTAVVLPVVLELLISLDRPIYYTRTFMYVLIPLLLLISIAPFRIPSRFRACRALPIGLCLLAFLPPSIFVIGSDRKEEWRQASWMIRVAQGPAELVLPDPPENGLGLQHYRAMPLNHEVWPGLKESVQRVVQDPAVRGVWVVRRTFSIDEPDSAAVTQLETAFERRLRHLDRTVQVEYFERRRPPP